LKYIKAKFVIFVVLLTLVIHVDLALASAPSAPSNLRVISGNEKLFLTWSHSNSLNSDLLGYKIYISVDLGESFDDLVGLPGTPPPNFYVIPNLENGKEYIIAITSYNDSLEESTMIKSETVIPADTSYTDTLAPENTSNLEVSPGDSEIVLTWDDSLDTQNDLVGYKLYISEDGGIVFDQGLNIGYVHRYTVSDLENGKEYVFKITGYDEVYNENSGILTEVVSSSEESSTINDTPGIFFGDDLPVTDTFADVDTSNIFKSYIEYLAARSIIKGYDGGMFYPNNYLTRGEAVKIILVATGSTDLSPIDETSFSDLSPENPLAPYIEEAYFYNIVRGYGDYTFKPDEPVLRQEFAKMFMEATQGTLENPVTKAAFVDVSLDHSFSKWIYSAYKKGYISGYEDSTFKALNKITRAEASKVVARYLQGETEQLPNNSNIELYLLSLMNASRIDSSISTLIVDRELSIIARNHAKDLAQNVKSPSSVGSDGKTVFDRLEDAGISYTETSENVAKINLEDRTDYQAIEALHSAIMQLPDNEPNQKTNILSTYKNFDTVGIGVYQEEDSSDLFVVVNFISS